MKTAIVSSVVGGKPLNGGNAWAVGSWVDGLRRLGLRVCLVEQIASAQCVDAAGVPVPFEQSANVQYFRTATEQMGLADAAVMVCDNGAAFCGMTRSDLLDWADAADLLVNITGHLTWEPVKARCRRKVYLDLDPGYTQFWHAAGNAGARLGGHDHYYTVGENIGTAECPIPTGGIRWRPTRQPVVLDEWPVVAQAEGTCPSEPGPDGPAACRFTTVASWRGAYGRAEFAGRTYGLKAHEFRRFADVPARVERAAHGACRFEAALDIHPADGGDLALLAGHGWAIADPRAVAADPASFRRYVRRSGAEFSVAQGVYVETNSGWFSDRTVRYLASGRPALVQDTGFTRHLPTGEGLVTFRTPDEAADGARRIAAEYAAHSRAARRVAETSFASAKVVSKLLDEME
jgi:hypothetical protein